MDPQASSPPSFDGHLASHGVPAPAEAVPAANPGINPPMPPAAAGPPPPAQPAAAVPTAVQPAPVAAAPSAPEPPAAPTPPQTYEGQPVTAAPWADPACAACGGWGFDSNGNPCPICAGTAPARGLLTPSRFSLEMPAGSEGSGIIKWTTSTATGTASGYCWVGPSAAAKVVASAPAITAPEVAPAPAATPAPAPAPAPTASQETPPAAPASPKEKEKKPGRKKKTFTLFVNCAPCRGATNSGATKVTYLSQLLNDEVGPLVASHAPQAANFYQLDPQSRRDALRSMGNQIASELTGNVVADGYGVEDSDIKALTDGIEPFSSFVVVPSFTGVSLPQATQSIGVGGQA